VEKDEHGYALRMVHRGIHLKEKRDQKVRGKRKSGKEAISVTSRRLHRISKRFAPSEVGERRSEK